MSRHTWRLFFLELFVRMLLSGVEASTWQCQEWCGHWNRNSAAWLGTFSSWSKIKCFQFTELSNDWRFILIGWYEKRFSVIDFACLLLKNFRKNTWILMDLLIFGKHLFIYWSGTAGALKFFPWLPLLRPIWIQRPRHPRPGLQGWGSETTKFAGSFVKNTGGLAFRRSSWEIFGAVAFMSSLTLWGWFPRLSSSS